MQKLLTIILLFLSLVPLRAQKALGPCEACELMFTGMPERLSWSTQIADAAEPGEALTISGTIYKPDGKTPAAGIILYVYHTDERGYYSPAKGQPSSHRHGHLRGWMKTDAQGRYRFTTIRPGAYPSRRAAQHIHPILLEPSGRYYYIDEYLFDDDPLLTADERSRQEKRGESGIIHLIKNQQGVWEGTRDITLGSNVPGYR